MFTRVSCFEKSLSLQNCTNLNFFVINQSFIALSLDLFATEEKACSLVPTLMSMLLACYWDERLPTPFLQCWALTSSSGGYLPIVVISLLGTPSTVCQSPPARMIAGSSVYAYLLETVVGKKGRQRAGAWRGHCPLPFHRRATGAEVPFHKSIIGNFMVYQDRIETNVLQLFAHPETSACFFL